MDLGFESYITATMSDAKTANKGQESPLNWQGIMHKNDNGFAFLGWLSVIYTWYTIIWYTSLMKIHKITPSVDYNYWLKGLDTLLYEPTNKNSTKVSQQIR